MRADVTVREFGLVNDEPAAVGGSDLGPTPTESTLQSLASCVAMVIRAASRKHGIPVSTVEAEAEAVADFDIRGVTFQQAVTVPFRRIDLTLRVGGPVTDADLAPVRNAIRDFCPVTCCFRRPEPRSPTHGCSRAIDCCYVPEKGRCFYPGNELSGHRVYSTFSVSNVL